jgi:hypothetical protein
MRAEVWKLIGLIKGTDKIKCPFCLRNGNAKTQTSEECRNKTAKNKILRKKVA